MLTTRVHKLVAALAFLMALVAGAPTVARADSPERPPLVEVKKRGRSSSDDDAPKARGSGGSKSPTTWFAYWFPESMRPIIKENQWGLLLVSMLFFSIGGGFWAPLIFLGAEVEQSWALPLLLYQVAFWAGMIMAMFFYWIYGIPLVLGCIIMLASAYLGSQTMITNLNHPSARLKKEGGGGGSSRKRRAKAADDDE